MYPPCKICSFQRLLNNRIKTVFVLKKCHGLSNYFYDNENMFQMQERVLLILVSNSAVSDNVFLLLPEVDHITLLPLFSHLKEPL